jgi:hypothetical protein
VSGAPRKGLPPTVGGRTFATAPPAEPLPVAPGRSSELVAVADPIALRAVTAHARFAAASAAVTVYVVPVAPAISSPSRSHS